LEQFQSSHCLWESCYGHGSVSLRIRWSCKGQWAPPPPTGCCGVWRPIRAQATVIIQHALAPSQNSALLSRLKAL